VRYYPRLKSYPKEQAFLLASLRSLHTFLWPLPFLGPAPKRGLSLEVLGHSGALRPREVE
jgi:hypothetical protein